MNGKVEKKELKLFGASIFVTVIDGKPATAYKPSGGMHGMLTALERNYHAPDGKRWVAKDACRAEMGNKPKEEEADDERPEVERNY